VDRTSAPDAAQSETAAGLRELLSSRPPRIHPAPHMVVTGPATEIPLVTVIVPAYNESERLPAAMPRLLTDSFLSPGRLSELIVVDDGSSDGTAEIARDLLTGYDNARVLRLPWHAGKGAAVRYGVAAARGEVIMFMDADLATELSITMRLLGELADCDVVIGSRAAAGAVTGRSRLRHEMHHAFKQHAQRFTGIEVSDPQCGFKAFRADVAKILFHLARTDGFGFDVEILLVARKLGYTIREIPVEWNDVAGSKVRMLRDPIGMAADIAMARVRHARRATPLLSPSPSQ
jgi:dolichyl-phosphate beta-glucosyltransferase